MLIGNITSIGLGAFFSIVVTYCTRWNMTKEQVEAEWEKTRDIDNPLSPWVQVYKGELNLDDGENFHDRPPLEIVIRKFRAAKITAYVAAVCFTLLFVCIWPGSMLSIDILDFSGFNIWTSMSRGWAFVAASFIIIVPMYQELKAITKQISKNKEDALCANNGEGATTPLANGNLVNNSAPQSTNAPKSQSNSNKHEYIFQSVRRVMRRAVSLLQSD